MASRRWRVLRERFARENRKMNKPIENGDTAIDAPKWLLFDQLSFLVEHIKPRSYEKQGTTAPINEKCALQGDDIQVANSLSESCTPTSKLDDRLSDNDSIATDNFMETDSLFDSRSPTHDNGGGGEALLLLKSMNNQIQQIVTKMDAADQPPSDSVAGFCDSIGSRLRTLSPRCQARAFIEINKALYAVEFPE